MAPTPDTGGDGVTDTRRESPRVQLARRASWAASRCDGVLALDPGPREHWCTFVDDDRIVGVVVIADEAPGRYAVSLYLRAALTDLRRLADEVRAAVRADADAHGLAERLGEVRIAITDIDDRIPAA